MMENGKILKEMGMVFNNGKMGQYIKENGLMICVMVN